MGGEPTTIRNAYYNLGEGQYLKESLGDTS
jgi:hypothetical protein